MQRSAKNLLPFIVLLVKKSVPLCYVGDSTCATIFYNEQKNQSFFHTKNARGDGESINERKT